MNYCTCGHPEEDHLGLKCIVADCSCLHYEDDEYIDPGFMADEAERE